MNNVLRKSNGLHKEDQRARGRFFLERLSRGRDIETESWENSPARKKRKTLSLEMVQHVKRQVTFIMTSN